MKNIIRGIYLSAVLLVTGVGSSASWGEVDQIFEHVKSDLPVMDARSVDRKIFRLTSAPKSHDLQRVDSYRLDQLSSGEVIKKEGASAVDARKYDLEKIRNEMRMRYIGPIDKRPPVDNTYSMRIGCDLYTLFVVEKIEDVRFNLNHITAVVDGEDGSYVRFTFPPDSDDLVATAHTSKGDYRITSSPIKPDQHVVYKLDGNSKKARRMVVNERHHSELFNLERRHLAVNQLANIQPFMFRETVSDQFVDITISGGDLGYVDIKKIENNPLALVETVVDELSPIAISDGSENFVIDSVIGDAESEYEIWYHQVIDGIPVYASNRIVINGKTGKIARLYSELAISGGINLNPDSAISKEGAVNLAVSKIEEVKGGTLGNMELIKDRAPLYYMPAADGIVLVRKLSLMGDVNGKIVIYSAFVNAITGEVELSKGYRNAAQNTDFSTDVCTNNAGAPLGGIGVDRGQV